MSRRTTVSTPSTQLKIASWGDTALDIPAAGLNEQFSGRTNAVHPGNSGPSSPEASGSSHARNTGHERSQPTSHRLHNLRPRAQPQLWRDDSDDTNAELESEYESVDDSPKASGQKKKVGRPIAYKGDPNAPHLTEDERRRLRRRVANRESARRVRNKQQEIMNDLESKVAAVELRNKKLEGHIAEVESTKTSLLEEIQSLRNKCSFAAQQNAELHACVEAMQEQLQEHHWQPDQQWPGK